MCFSTDTVLKKMIVRNNVLYGMFLEATGAGPLDGGCLVMATALQAIKGGDLYSVVGKTREQALPSANHVVLRVGNVYWDADGPSTEKALLRRWEKEEGLENPTLRPFKDGDVPGTCRDKKLINSLVVYLKQGISPAPDVRRTELN